MNILRASIAVFIGTVLLASSASPQTPMKFCELMRDSEKYNGKLVKIRATWIYGFEWSYLHCLDCDTRVWLNTSEIDEKSEKMLKHTPGAGIVNVDVEGVFHAGGHYGHLNGYKYELAAHSVDNPVFISEGMKSRGKEHEIELKFACGGANPR